MVNFGKSDKIIKVSGKVDKLNTTDLKKKILWQYPV